MGSADLLFFAGEIIKNFLTKVVVKFYIKWKAFLSSFQNCEALDSSFKGSGQKTMAKGRTFAPSLPCGVKWTDVRKPPFFCLCYGVKWTDGRKTPCFCLYYGVKWKDRDPMWGKMDGRKTPCLCLCHVLKWTDGWKTPWICFCLCYVG